jgi:hypothetical protein
MAQDPLEMSLTHLAIIVRRPHIVDAPAPQRRLFFWIVTHD